MSDLAKIGAALAVGGALGALASAQAARSLNSQLQPQPQPQAPQFEPLPTLYVYDHCPFCVRARVVLGLKGVRHELVFLLSADEATPVGLVGAKQAPIFRPVGGRPFPESMDIVRYVDAHFGDRPLLQEPSGREDLKAWIADAWPVLSVLYYPRIGAAPLPEFAQRESREYFRAKKEKQVAPFAELLAQTPEAVAKANALLERLADILRSPSSVNEAVGYDDLDLFGRLRALTLVKGVKWPPKVRAYVDHFSQAGDVPLFDAMATM